MRIARLFLLSALMLSGALGLSPSARAAEPYQGLFTIIDPYNQSHQSLLQNAAQTPCSPAGTSTTTPFCNASNGILLRVAWCSFQLYHIPSPAGPAYRSCHYQTGYSGPAGTAPVQLTSSDMISPCNGTFDICTGATQGVLARALRSIVQINNQRANAGYPPLKLSIGMNAGVSTPQSVLDSVGYVDVPHNNSPTPNASLNECYRLPLLWKATFISQFEQAQDQLLSFIKAQMPAGANIVTIKPGAISATDLEVEMPGQSVNVTAPGDPGPAGPGPALSCSKTTPGATLWLNAYNANPLQNLNFSSANESTFGQIIGHTYASALNLGLGSVLISLPTTNGSAFPYVSCGQSGLDACSIQPNTGNWSTYYFQLYISHLFNGGIAYQYAAAAYQAVRADSFSFAPQQLSVNSTALSNTTINASTQLPCTTNNTLAALAPSQRVGGSSVTMLGVGTTIGWQTMVNSGGQCAAGTFGTTLGNGISNGALFLEVQTDAAFDDLPACATPMKNALSQILAEAAPTTCSY